MATKHVRFFDAKHDKTREFAKNFMKLLTYRNEVKDFIARNNYENAFSVAMLFAKEVDVLKASVVCVKFVDKFTADIAQIANLCKTQMFGAETQTHFVNMFRTVSGMFLDNVALLCDWIDTDGHYNVGKINAIINTKL